MALVSRTTTVIPFPSVISRSTMLASPRSRLQKGTSPSWGADHDMPDTVFLGKLQDGLDDIVALVSENGRPHLLRKCQGVRDIRWVAASITVGRSRDVCTYTAYQLRFSRPARRDA